MKLLGFIRFLMGQLYHLYICRSSESYVEHLRKLGVRVGEQTKFYDPSSNVVDITRPYMISIGNKVKITRGVKILTHGFDWCVLRECYKRPFGSAGRVDIGDNVYIGMDAIILKGVKIGRDSIVAAGSVVTKNVPDCSVVAGNPAKVICTIHELYEKYISREKHEAASEAYSISSQLGRSPKPEDFKEFFYLFIERDPNCFGNIPVQLQVGDYMREFLNSKPEFDSFDDFMVYVNSMVKHGDIK